MGIQLGGKKNYYRELWDGIYITGSHGWVGDEIFKQNETIRDDYLFPGFINHPLDDTGTSHFGTVSLMQKITHRIPVWYIYLHLVDLYGEYR